MSVQTRTLYIYGSLGVEPLNINQRVLQVYGSLGVEPLNINQRVLQVYGNLGVEPLNISQRALYIYGAIVDLPPFPWIASISPISGGWGTLVTIAGDGFGNAQTDFDMAVELGGVTQPVTFWSWETIEFLITDNMLSGYVRVVRRSPSVNYSNAKYFRIEITPVSGLPVVEVRVYDELGNYISILKDAV